MDAGMPNDEPIPDSVYELLELADGCNYTGRVPAHLTDAFDFACARALVWQHTGGFLVTDAGTGVRALHRMRGGAGCTPKMNAECWEAFPIFDPTSPKWVKAPGAATLENVAVDTLKTYRGKGVTSPNGLRGIDGDGRKWAKGNANAHVWYLRSSLRCAVKP